MQICFTSRIGPNILTKVFEDYILYLNRAGWVLLIFIPSKSKDFWSGALLKIPPSSPSMKNLVNNKIDSTIFDIHYNSCFQQTSTTLTGSILTITLTLTIFLTRNTNSKNADHFTEYAGHYIKYSSKYVDPGKNYWNILKCE